MQDCVRPAFLICYVLLVYNIFLKTKLIHSLTYSMYFIMDKLMTNAVTSKEAIHALVVLLSTPCCCSVMISPSEGIAHSMLFFC